MSEYKNLKGRLEEVDLGVKSLELYCKDIIMTNDPNFDLSGDCCESYTEAFMDEEYEDYVAHKGKLYKVYELCDEDDGDVFHANINKDGNIEFVLHYYNGGMSFNDAIEEALDNMKK